MAKLDAEGERRAQVDAERAAADIAVLRQS